jgi:membrane-bound serine protease (ClpP class)
MLNVIRNLLVAALLLLSLDTFSDDSISEPTYVESAPIVVDIPDTTTSDATLIYKFDLKSEIGPATWRTTSQSIDRAVEMNADLIIIHMNTYGGMVVAADSIRTKILQSPIPVYVFVDNNAISAGALIAIAADKIYMREGASIGAATVVNQTGEVVPDKYQSFMRSMMRATAEAHGKDTIVTASGETTYRWKRDPQVAEAMVDPSIVIPNVIEEGKVLTLTTEEAISLRFCEGRVERIDDILKANNITNFRIEEYVLSPLERIIQFLINPYLQGILIMIIIGGIYFELQTPGIGFPIAASVIAALLYFAPLYLEGLASNWELVIFFIGIILIAVEIFALPGFGFAGFAGIFLVVLGLSLAMIDNIVFEWDFTIGLLHLIRSICIVVGSAAVALVLSIIFGKSFLDNPNLGRVMLTAEQRSSDGYLGVEDLSYLLGTYGVARTMLRPSGKVEVEGRMYNAVCESGFIEQGNSIKVIRYETGQLYVKKV